jgi:hypothetical protein
MDHTVLADPPEQIRAFVRDGRIAAFPAKRPRRRMLLDAVAQAFEPGRTYCEADVDEVLKQLSEDHCALRRYLVDEDFMSRSDGAYRRSGGSFAERSMVLSHPAPQREAGMFP